MWKITRDYITSEQEKIEGKTWVGKGNWNEEKIQDKEQFKFRLKDDDNLVYLYGISTNDSSFAPCDYFKNLLGTTIIEYKKKDNKWRSL